MVIQPTKFQSRAQILSQIFNSRAQTQYKNSRQKERKTYQTKTSRKKRKKHKNHTKKYTQKNLSKIDQNYTASKITQMIIQPTIFQSRAQILSQFFDSRAQTQFKNSRQEERKT